jgi:heat shock protein HtpX
MLSSAHRLYNTLQSALLAHVRANDMWVMTLADMVARLTALLSLFGQVLLVLLVPFALAGEIRLPLLPLAVLIFAPAVSALLQLALSRIREYDADLAAAELTGDPRALAPAAAYEDDPLFERPVIVRVPRWHWYGLWH